MNVTQLPVGFFRLLLCNPYLRASDLCSIAVTCRCFGARCGSGRLVQCAGVSMVEEAIRIRCARIENNRDALDLPANKLAWKRLVRLTERWTFTQKHGAQYRLLDDTTVIKRGYLGNYDGICIATMGNITLHRGRHYFEWERTQMAGSYELKNGWFCFGFCRPDTDASQPAFYQHLDFPLVHHKTLCWYTLSKGEKYRRIKRHLTDASDLEPGERVGLLLDLTAGTISLVRSNKVVGDKIITGVSGPLLPCVLLFFPGVSVRLYGNLPLPVELHD